MILGGCGDLSENILHGLKHLVPSWQCLGEVMQPLGGGALLEELCHYGKALRVHHLTLFPVHALF